MNKKIILPFVVLMVLAVAMVGAASADEAVDEIEIRGSIVDPDSVPIRVPAISVVAPGALTSCTWNAYDFAAFWYDLDDDLSTETLTINTAAFAGGNGPIGLAVGSSRTLDEKELIYNTGPQLLAYEVTKAYNGGPLGATPIVKVKGAENEALIDKNGNTLVGDTEVCYAVVGWWAEKYIGINGRADKLAKLILEFSSTDKKTLATDEAWDLGGGYTLTAKQIDLAGAKVWLQLDKNGVEIDSTIIGKEFATDQDLTYVVNKDIASEKDIPIFVARVDAVFRGTESNLVQLKYVWLISNEVEEIKSGDTYGQFKIGACGATGVTAENENAITLSQNTEIDLYDTMKFKVADDAAAVRFYPLAEKTIGEVVTPVEEEETPTEEETPEANVTPTEVVTPAPTPEATAVVTATTAEETATTAEPEATKKKTPGFEAVFAIAGLLAVAYLVLRQRE